MKKIKILITLLTLLSLCFVLSACQSEQAKIVDEKILTLSTKEVSLEIGKDVYEIEELNKTLTEKEHNSLKNYSTFESIATEYRALEDKAVEEIEAKIKAIPSVESIKLSSEDVIDDASYAYSKATDEVKNRVTNVDVLSTAKERYEKVKADSWVACTTCGGDGRKSCSLCGGSGSRKVNHTTPNGKTWQVWADCATTQSCYSCNGLGGKYVEKAD